MAKKKPRTSPRRAAGTRGGAGRPLKTKPGPKRPVAPKRAGRSGASSTLPAKTRHETEAAAFHAATAALPPFLVVGVGASAGGYEAFSKLLHALPSDIGVAFVLVQHLDPTHDSLLPSLLGAHSPLPVVQVTHAMRLEPNRVHVIPPDAQVTVRDRRLLLTKRPSHGSTQDRADRRAAGMPQLPPFMPIDAFLRSLAEYGRSRAIGIVLSGSASDGTLGLGEIKAAGGITFAQDPATADYDSMPRSAVASGAVDLVMAPEHIAAELVRIARHPLAGANGAASGDAPVALAGEEHLGRIFMALKQTFGVDFTQYKLPTLRRRLQRRIVLHKFDTLEQYAALLQSRPDEMRALYQDLLINVTQFFRDPATFTVLAEKVFPSLLAAQDAAARKGPRRGERAADRPADRATERTIRIWVPGCSSGEEAYSVAIALLESLGDRAHDFDIQVFATDVADAVLERARAGLYPEAIAADVSPERLRRYFTRVNGHYRINKLVRDMVVFARQDLTRDPPFSKLDLIVCRNVLIYFGAALQRRLMAVFHYALKPDGFLLLASAETAGPASDLFSVADKKHRLYSKRAAAAPRPGIMLPSRVAPADYRPAAPRGAAGDGHAPADLQGEANRIILSRYAPPGVVVDGDHRIVHFRGQTGPYLEAPPGEPSLSVLKMAREGLLYALRSALQEARTRDAPVRRDGLSVRADGKARDVRLDVIPLAQPGGSRHYLILFDDPARAHADGPAAPAAAKQSGASGRKAPAKGDAARPGANRQLALLERELAASREYMQTIIQDLETANEELQSANEEILSSNEELQSTNEELDTAKEELQSTNEELNTLNDELSGRNEELSHVNGDLMNLLANVNIAIVMVASDLRVRRFTPMAEKLLNLIPTDVGRPISDIKPNLDCPDLEHLIATAIETVSVQETECHDRDGRSYSVRVRPYKNLDNRIDGAVVALVDVDSLRRQETRARDAGERADAADRRAVTARDRADAADRRAGDSVERRDHAEAVFEFLPEPMLLIDEKLNVRGANLAFRRAFHLQPDDAAGRPVFEILDSAAGAKSALRDVLARTLKDNPKGAAGDHRIDLDVRGARHAVRVRSLRSDSRGPLLLLSLEGAGSGGAHREKSPSSAAEDNGDNNGEEERAEE